MQSYSTLLNKLCAFEASQFAAINAAVPGMLSGMSGHVQSVVLEPGTETDEERPVLVGVGINFHQNSSLTRVLTPYLGGVVDNLVEMRGALDVALPAYQRNAGHWAKAKACSGTALKIPQPYWLVAFNLSPFITTLRWKDLGGGIRPPILALWPHLLHLHAFLNTIGRVDLWVVHGNSPKNTFRSWAASRGVGPWISTYNLSGLGRANMLGAAANPNHPKHHLYK